MAHSFTRLELYNLVWSEPMRDIAARLGLSDVGLAKACRNASIPVPPRGYWNRKKAGLKVTAFSLPPREPGHPDRVTIGKERYWHYPPEPVDENEPDPPPPTFDEPIEAVRARVEKRTDAVHVRKDLALAHPAIRKLLEKDEQLREKQSQYSWLGDWLAERTLVDFLGPIIRHAVHGLTPPGLREDLIQEVWAHLWARNCRVLRRWNGEGQFLGFVWVVARNQVRDRLATLRRRPPVKAIVEPPIVNPELAA